MYLILVKMCSRWRIVSIVDSAEHVMKICDGIADSDPTILVHVCYALLPEAHRSEIIADLVKRF